MSFFDALPKNSAALLIGPPLSGQKKLFYDYVNYSLQKQEPVLVISTDSIPQDINAQLGDVSSFEQSGSLKYIDCYSQQIQEDVKDTPSVKHVCSPIALNEMSILLSSIQRDFIKKNEHHHVVFNSLSTMLMYSNANMIGRFIQVMTGKIKRAGGTVLFLIEEGMHEEKVVVTIEHLMNVVIHVKQDGSTVVVKAEGLSGFEDWKSYAVS